MNKEAIKPLEEALNYKADYAYVFMCEKIDQAIAILTEQPPGLNPCPYPPCKGEGKLQQNAGIYYVYCKNCGRHTDSFGSDTATIKAWNNTNKEEQPPAGEFTKKARRRITTDRQLISTIEDTDETIAYLVIADEALLRLAEACDRLDRSEAENKKKDELLFAYESVRAPKQPPAGEFTKRIFSGKESQEFWDAVSKSESDILYEYGCKAQELEANVLIGLRLAEAILVQKEYGIDHSEYILKTAKEFIAKEKEVKK